MIAVAISRQAAGISSSGCCCLLIAQLAKDQRANHDQQCDGYSRMRFDHIDDAALLLLRLLYCHYSSLLYGFGALSLTGVLLL
jgi:hypothetical protein